MSTNVQWVNSSTLPSKRFTCGHCGGDITSNVGYEGNIPSQPGHKKGQIYVCHNCDSPTYFSNDGKQWPGAKLGSNVENLPKDISDLHNEIRDATAASAYTAAVLAARKLLMHIAVELGAEEGKNFTVYVDYLVDNHYAPPNSKSWVDKIRLLGNEANHEIKIVGASEATNIIRFLDMLLLFNYEFPDNDISDVAAEA